MPSSAKSIYVPPEETQDNDSPKKNYHTLRSPECLNDKKVNVVEHITVGKNDSSSNSLVEASKIEIKKIETIPHSTDDKTLVESEDFQNTSNGSNKTSDEALDKLDVAATFAVDPTSRRNSGNYESEEFLYFSKPPAQRLFDKISRICEKKTLADPVDSENVNDEKEKVETKTVIDQLRNADTKEEANSDEEETDMLTTSSEISMQVQDGSTKNPEDIEDDEVSLLGKTTQNQAHLDEEVMSGADENQEVDSVGSNLPNQEALKPFAHTENYRSELSIIINNNSSVGGNPQDKKDGSGDKLQSIKIQNWIDNCDKSKNPSKEKQLMKDIGVALARLNPAVPSMADMAELIDMTEAIELNMVCEEKKTKNQMRIFRPEIMILSTMDDDTPETSDTTEDYPDQPYWDDELEEEMAKLYAASTRSVANATDDDCPDLEYPTPPNEGADNERENYPPNNHLEEFRRIIQGKSISGPGTDDDVQSLEGSVSDDEIPEISSDGSENLMSPKNKEMPQQSKKDIKAMSTSVEQLVPDQEDEEIMRGMSIPAFNFSATEMAIIKTKMGKLSTIIEKMKEAEQMTENSLSDHELNLWLKSTKLGAIGEEVLETAQNGAAAASPSTDSFEMISPAELIPHQADGFLSAKAFLACNKKRIISRMLVGEDNAQYNNDDDQNRNPSRSRTSDDDIPALEDVSCPVPSECKVAGRMLERVAEGTNSAPENSSTDGAEMCEPREQMTPEEMEELGRKTGAIPRIPKGDSANKTDEEKKEDS